MSMTFETRAKIRASLWEALKELGDPRTVSRPEDNPILDTDSYKIAHQPMYKKIGVQAAFSYIEPRIKQTDVLYTGMQIWLKRMKPITHDMVDEAKAFYGGHITNSDILFPEAAWRRVVDEFGGYPPLVIRAVKEGSVLPSQNALVTIECDIPELAWMGAYFETSILRAVWYSTTVATKAFHIRQMLREKVRQTSDGDVEQTTMFMHHDFGGRGVSSAESAGYGTAAFLVSGSYGSDTITGIQFANQYLNAEMGAYSVFATEHSVMTMRGIDGELETVRDCIKTFNLSPGTIVSLVSDGYNIFKLAMHYCTTLKQEILDSGIRLVIRPDSGDPVAVILRLLAMFDEYYGSTVNSKGFKVLNVVRILQGDGLSGLEDFTRIADEVINAGFSIENIVFGQGGGLLQMVNRDELKFAMKTCAANVNGEWVDVFKDPITDSGKTSKKGRIETFRNKVTGRIATLRIAEADPEIWESMMETIYDHGQVLLNDTLAEMRSRSVGI